MTTSISNSEARRAALRRYWCINIAVLTVLLLIWAAVGLGCGILFAAQLNAYTLSGTGYPLGFWFAQQGAIIVFVLLILVYCVAMNAVDAAHVKELNALKTEEDGKASLPPSAGEGI